MDRFFFLRRSAKKTIDVPSIFPCFFRVFLWNCPFNQSGGHSPWKILQLPDQPTARNLLTQRRRKSPDPFFLFRPVGSGREKWLRKLPGSCGLLPLRKTTWACRKVHLLNYHYKVWLIRGTFHEVFVDVNGFYQPRPLKCPSQWLCQPCV